MTEHCILWPGTRTNAGYGRVGDHLAHRFIWTLFNGAIPNGHHVCHRCDNPPCVNPAHLFIGTPQDNIADMMTKGRAKHPMMRAEGYHVASKLNQAQVLDIRRRAAGAKRGTQAALAREYGVSVSTICMIVKRKVWTHI